MKNTAVLFFTLLILSVGISCTSTTKDNQERQKLFSVLEGKWYLLEKDEDTTFRTSSTIQIYKDSFTPSLAEPIFEEPLEIDEQGVFIDYYSFETYLDREGPYLVLRSSDGKKNYYGRFPTYSAPKMQEVDTLNTQAWTLDKGQPHFEYEELEFIPYNDSIPTYSRGVSCRLYDYEDQLGGNNPTYVLDTTYYLSKQNFFIIQFLDSSHLWLLPTACSTFNDTIAFTRISNERLANADFIKILEEGNWQKEDSILSLNLQYRLDHDKKFKNKMIRAFSEIRGYAKLKVNETTQEFDIKIPPSRTKIIFFSDALVGERKIIQGILLDENFELLGWTQVK